MIGAGPSGMDLANEISKVAKRVSLSHHQNPKPKTVFASNVDMRPDVKRLTENSAVFVDGSEQTYSVIVYCTGYKYTFPFLSVDCGISVDENYVKPLYKHCININHPTMALIGVPFYVCASQMFDLQVNILQFFSTQRNRIVIILAYTRSNSVVCFVGSFRHEILFKTKRIAVQKGNDGRYQSRNGATLGKRFNKTSSSYDGTSSGLFSTLSNLCLSMLVSKLNVD